MADPATIGRYEPIEPIGRGGMGKVYRARDPWMDRLVAVKTIELDAGDDRDEARLRVMREIRASAKLVHPNIVQVYDVGQQDSLAFIVMELVEGRPPQGPLAPGAALGIVRQMAAALDFAHSHGIVHRDIKPANVLVDAAGRAKVLDFGIARMAGERSLTRTGLTAGTPFYMAPEQLQGRAVGPSADQYALGVTAYELLTGVKPFSGDSFASVICAVLTTEPPPMSGVSPAVEAAVRRALAKEPAARYSNCAEFAEALAAAIRSAEPAPTERMRPPAPPVSPAPARADRAIFWAAGAALLLFVAAAVGVGWAILGRQRVVEREPARLVDSIAQREAVEAAAADEPPPGFESWGPDSAASPDEASEPEWAGPREIEPTADPEADPAPAAPAADAAESPPPPRAAVKAPPRPAPPPAVARAAKAAEPASEPAPLPPVEPASETTARAPVHAEGEVNGAAAAEPAVERKPGELTGAEIEGAMFEFVWIPPGVFEMGCSAGDADCADDERPRRRVGVSPGFQMARHETTQAQWTALMDSNPSRFPGADRPVDSVSWNDVQAYLAKLNARRDGYRYRLPTEAEWEYAARAGSAAARWGDLDRIAWHSGNAGRETHPVGGKRPNAWGLHDMLGNVAEWCADWYAADAYANAPERSPRGPASGSARVVRGGSWFDLLPQVFRVSRRSSSPPGLRLRSFGFRLAREKTP